MSDLLSGAFILRHDYFSILVIFTSVNRIKSVEYKAVRDKEEKETQMAYGGGKR